MPANSFRFFSNRQCCFFPCHAKADPEIFNCLFCYCPLHALSDCGGNYAITQAGLKDCTACLYPHLPENYENLLAKLASLPTYSHWRAKI